MQKPKGTYDVYGEYGKKVTSLLKILETLMEKYNFEYVRTPIFESSEVFHRGVGETTDIVSKETYDFKDRADRSMTLRPEGTAGVVRSFIENKMYANVNQPVKTWYYGPMYRYERPQSGRYREFYQFGVEVFGSNDPVTDAEVISVAVNFFKILGLKGIKVNINTLGDNESREKYREALIEYFRPHIDTLCEDCKTRFLKNPLRILDCKVDKDSEILKNAPITLDYLNEESKKHFEAVKEYLTKSNIDYVVDPSVVRGLDYYTNTVFEVEAQIEGFGSQNVLLGGGRYNNLVSMIGGPATPGVGFALGFERIITALDNENIKLFDTPSVDAYIIPLSENEKGEALSLANSLRLNGFIVEIDHMARNFKNNFKQCDRLNDKTEIIIGEEEVKNNMVTVKNLKTKEEEKVELMFLVEYLDNILIDECSCGCDECHDDCECKH